MMQAKLIIAIAAAGAFALVSAPIASAGTIAGATTTAEYYFNGNVNDSSGNGYNGTVSGTTAYTAGPGGRSAFSFDGSTNIATTTTDNLMLANHSFTVDAWVYFNGTITGDEGIFGTSANGIGDQGLHLQERTGGNPSATAIMMGFYGDDLQPNSPAVSGGTWYNIAWVFDATDPNNKTQSIYEDGMLVAGPRTSNYFQGTGLTATIGTDCCDSTSLKGAVSNLFVFNSALTQQQVQAAAAVVPEPSVFALIGLGSIAALRRRRAL